MLPVNISVLHSLDSLNIFNYKKICFLSSKFIKNTGFFFQHQNLKNSQNTSSECFSKKLPKRSQEVFQYYTHQTHQKLLITKKYVSCHQNSLKNTENSFFNFRILKIVKMLPVNISVLHSLDSLNIFNDKKYVSYHQNSLKNTGIFFSTLEFEKQSKYFQ